MFIFVYVFIKELGIGFVFVFVFRLLKIIISFYVVMIFDRY